MIVLSAHLDDAVWSASSWLLEHDCEIVTICAGIPPAGTPPTQFDQRAGFASGDEAMRARREEDEEAAEMLGCWVRHLDILDAGYGAIDGAIEREVDDLLADADGVVLGPLGLSHPDHIRVARAFRRAAREHNIDAWCYEDLPYARMHPESVVPALAEARAGGITAERASPASKEAYVRAYRSQVGPTTHMREILGPERFHRLP